MKLIKLDTIDSTNDFLKALSVRPYTENFTVVTAENQTKGKGQRGAKWDSEIGKNLMFSVLVKDLIIQSNRIFDLNVAVALSIISILEKFEVPNLSVKWPNDILSDKMKIGGILIENSFKSDGTVVSIVGIGLNVNQTNFEYLPKASSLACIKNRQFDKELILNNIVEALKKFTDKWEQEDIQSLWKEYNEVLFKKGIPMPFQNENGQFMGIIKDVSFNGKLRVILEDDSVKEFDVKEIQMLY